MAQLIIKGHKTRGAEVIAILEMLGGKNKHNYSADCDSLCFYIGKGTNTIYYDWVNACYEDEDTPIFSLEEFEEKYPYKVGDRVIIKVNNQEAIIDKAVWCCDTIIYWLKYDDCLEENWRTEHLRPYKEETMNRKYNVEEYLKVWDAAEKGLEVFVNDNFELKEDNGKFYIIKKQPQYPKTYKECCEVLMGKTDFQDFELVLTKLSITQAQNSTNIFPSVPPNVTLINNFYKLLICRDAYWRMAGEQMGLVKPWKPDWTEGSQQKKYCIYKECSNIKKGVLYSANTTLAFPTAEIRDAFLENFKELIEECKELL